MSWDRLESSTVDPEVSEGLEARVADPLWFLARQWQLGEFNGEDASTPMLMRARVHHSPITEYRPGNTRRWLPRVETGPPLEAMVEVEPVREGPAGPRLALEAGASLLRRLAVPGIPASVVDHLIRSFPIRPPADDGLDPVGIGRLRLLAARCPDGHRIRRQVEGAADPAVELGLDDLAPRTASRVNGLIEAWLAEEADLFAEPASPSATSWDQSHLEYRFAVRAETGQGPVVLNATGYRGGRLDWYHFDRGGDQKKGTDRWPATKTIEILPAPLRFAGMAASRWWELEDGEIYFGDLATAPEDLARSVVAGYAAVHGDDWYIMPCTLAAGSVAQVAGVTVIDDFGQARTIEATAAIDGPSRIWRWFELTGDRGPARGEAPLLFLPPVVADADRSDPLESVTLLRDEAANLAWAIEGRVQASSGRPAMRGVRARDRPVPAEEPPAVADAWPYQLSGEIPLHWYPLLPVQIPGGRPEMALRRGRLPDTEDPPMGRLVAGQPFLVAEEEIPDAGLVVERHYELARSVDGGVHVWIGRRRDPAGGSRSSPVSFDRLADPPDPAT